jgi:hypothetical protein
MMLLATMTFWWFMTACRGLPTISRHARSTGRIPFLPQLSSIFSSFLFPSSTSYFFVPGILSMSQILLMMKEDGLLWVGLRRSNAFLLLWAKVSSLSSIASLLLLPFFSSSYNIFYFKAYNKTSKLIFISVDELKHNTKDGKAFVGQIKSDNCFSEVSPSFSLSLSLHFILSHSNASVRRILLSKEASARK